MEKTEEKESLWSNTYVAFFAALFCCILWGSASPAIKLAYQIFQIPPEDTASRLMLAGNRFVLAGVMTILFGSIIKRKFLFPRQETLPKIAVLSLLQTVGQYYFFFMSLANTTGVRGSIINASGNFLAIIFSVYFFRMEKMTLRKWIGCTVGFMGIVLLLGGNNILEGGRVSLSGEGAMIAADVFYALSGCTIKIFSKDEDPVVLSGYQFLLGGIVLFLIGWLMGGRLIFYSASCVENLVYLGFISAGAYTIWGILLKYNPVSRISIMGFLNPVMGVLLSALFLGENKEAFSPVGMCSLLLVVAGILFVNFKQRQKG